MIQGDEFFPGEDRVHMLGTEVVADKAGLLCHTDVKQVNLRW